MSTVNGSNIQNAGTNLYADVNGGNVAPGTNVIIYTLNQTGGTRNQDVWIYFLWYIIIANTLIPVAIHPCQFGGERV